MKYVKDKQVTAALTSLPLPFGAVTKTKTAEKRSAICTRQLLLC